MNGSVVVVLYMKVEKPKRDAALIVECKHCGALDEVVVRKSDLISYKEFCASSDGPLQHLVQHFNRFFPYLDQRESRLLLVGLCEQCVEPVINFYNKRCNKDIEGDNE